MVWCRPALALLLLAVASVAAGVSSGAVEAARARLEAASTPNERAVALADLSTAYTGVMETLRASLRAMPEREMAAREHLGPANGAALASMGALHRALATPAAATLAHPAGPVAASRARLALAGMARHAASRRHDLTQAIGALERLEAERRDTLAALEAAMRGLDTARRDIAAGFGGGGSGVSDEPEIDLAALAARLDDDVLNEDDALAQRAALLAARGALPLPAPVEARPDGFGISLRVPPAAALRSPTLATVRHAGPVRPLGDVVVLEPAPGALIVIQGLEELRVSTGAILDAGQPIGLFEMADPTAHAYVMVRDADTGDAAPRRLYIELWLDGRREDAAEWFDLDPGRPARLQ
jgi:hypothetical protein